MSCECHIWVADIEKSLRHYVEVFDFRIVLRWPDPEPTRFALLELNGSRIEMAVSPSDRTQQTPEWKSFLGKVRERMGKPGAITIAIQVPDVDAHYARAVSHGAKIMTPLNDEFWNWRQYTAEDPDGYWLVFYKEVKGSPSR